MRPKASVPVVLVLRTLIHRFKNLPSITTIALCNNTKIENGSFIFVCQHSFTTSHHKWVDDVIRQYPSSHKPAPFIQTIGTRGVRLSFLRYRDRSSIPITTLFLDSFMINLVVLRFQKVPQN